MGGLFFYTIISIYFFIPSIQASIDYLDLSHTGDFLRFVSSILLIFVTFPIIYFLGKLILKQNITVEEYNKRKEEEKKKKEGEKKE